MEYHPHLLPESKIIPSFTSIITSKHKPFSTSPHERSAKSSLPTPNLGTGRFVLLCGEKVVSRSQSSDLREANRTYKFLDAIPPSPRCVSWSYWYLPTFYVLKTTPKCKVNRPYMGIEDTPPQSSPAQEIRPY